MAALGPTTGTDERERVAAKWAQLEAVREAAWERLSGRLRPCYDDLAEAFALVLMGDGEVRGAHARAATRQALEREAARYDRYAGRLLADGIELEYPTAMTYAIAFYVNSWEWAASPGALLGSLAGEARRLRRRWLSRHPDVAERRRSATLARHARAERALAERGMGFRRGFKTIRDWGRAC